MKDRRKDNEKRGEIEKLNALEDAIKEFSPHIHFYIKTKKEAIKAGIDNLIDYEGYL